MPKFFDTDEIFKHANEDLITLGIHISRDQLRYDYEDLCTHLYQLSKTDVNKYYKQVRKQSEEDFFFFAYYVLNTPLEHPFLIARCYEIQDKGTANSLSLWAREHYKTTLLSVCLSIWEVIKDPNTTIGIFSYERKGAKSILETIKQQLEKNELLIACWPEIFPNKKNEADKWNLDYGLYCKRSIIVREPTFSAHGFLEGLPVGMHFSTLVIDDVVVPDNSATPEQIDKVKKSFKKAMFLTKDDSVIRISGTRYDVNDVYADIIKSNRWRISTYPAEVDPVDGEGKLNSTSVFKSREALEFKLTESSPGEYAAQMLQDPTKSDSEFKLDWLAYYKESPQVLNKYLIVDPANAKNKKSDYSVFAVIGASPDRQFFLVDLVRDKMDVYERFETLVRLYKEHNPYDCYYEIQGLNSDLEVFDREMERIKYYFPIQRLTTNVKDSKYKRINNLASEFRKKNFLLPTELWYEDIEGNDRELISEFINEEYTKFPHNKSHDDMLDAMSWIQSIDVVFPDPSEMKPTKTEFGYKSSSINPLAKDNINTTWKSSYVW